MSLTEYFVEGVVTGAFVILPVIAVLSIFLVPALMWWEHLQWMKVQQKELDEMKEKLRQNAVRREKMKDFKW